MFVMIETSGIKPKRVFAVALDTHVLADFTLCAVTGYKILWSDLE